MRSISSASPPAVGKKSTGWPKCPQRATAASRPMRGEYHWDLTNAMLIDAPLARRRGRRASWATCRAPGLNTLPEQVRKFLDLVQGVQRGYLLAHGVLGLG